MTYIIKPFDLIDLAVLNEIGGNLCERRGIERIPPWQRDERTARREVDRHSPVEQSRSPKLVWDPDAGTLVTEL